MDQQVGPDWSRLVLVDALPLPVLDSPVHFQSKSVLLCLNFRSLKLRWTSYLIASGMIHGSSREVIIAVGARPVQYFPISKPS
jgi:hypothetical protein